MVLHITTSSRRTPGPIPRDAALGQEGRRLPNNQRWWLSVPAFAGTTRVALLVLHRLALDKSLAALHLVRERRLVDLDHDGIGLDAEVLHQRLRDIAHHAGLLFIGAAGGHADGDFRHFSILPFLLLRRSSRTRSSTRGAHACARLEGCAHCPHGSRRRKSASSP